MKEFAGDVHVMLLALLSWLCGMKVTNRQRGGDSSWESLRSIVTAATATARKSSAENHRAGSFLSQCESCKASVIVPINR